MYSLCMMLTLIWFVVIGPSTEIRYKTPLGLHSKELSPGNFENDKIKRKIYWAEPCVCVSYPRFTPHCPLTWLLQACVCIVCVHACVSVCAWYFLLLLPCLYVSSSSSLWPSCSTCVYVFSVYVPVHLCVFVCACISPLLLIRLLYVRVCVTCVCIYIFVCFFILPSPPPLPFPLSFTLPLLSSPFRCTVAPEDRVLLL